MKQAPGAEFLASAEFDAGLAGTVGVRVRTADGSDELARTTAEITEDVTVGTRSVYVRELTAPVLQGDYLIVWDDGAAIVTEELVVTYSLLDTPLPTGHDLCTVADVQSYLPAYVSNAATDAKLQQLVTAESEQFQADANFELVATEPSQPAARVFTIFPGWGQRVHVGAIATSAGLAVALLDDEAVATSVDAADVTPFYGPLRQPRAAWHPITAVEIRTPTLREGQLVRVTATWGYPAIPNFVREAVAATVILRYLSDVAETGTTLADALDNVNIRGLVVRRQDALAALQALQPPVLA